MTQKLITVSLIAAVALLAPLGNRPATAAETEYLRVATLAPRDSDLAKGFMKLDKGMRSATSNAWGVKLYASGVAGDEPDVIRKMKIGQMDASIITSVGLSQIVRETTLLNTPGIVRTYRALEEVEKVMTPEWEREFDKAGYKLVTWGESGQVRWFAKSPVMRPSAIKTMRPWVWPAAHAMKEMIHVIGATGVPLAVPEVYGALQTNMIDVVTSTAVALVALQWHASLKYVTKTTGGVLVGAMLMNSAKWNSMPPEIQKIVLNEMTRNQESDKAEIRKADERSYENLLKRGFTANEWNGEALTEYEQIADQVQKRLAGRIYSAESLDRVKTIAAPYNK